MKYLITGGKGFIGTHLFNQLVSNGHECFVLDIENMGVLNKENFTCFQKKKIDVVIHLASKTHVPESWEEPEEYLEFNYLGTLNTIEFCRKNKAKMIYVSSYMYGKPDYLPIDENHKLRVNNPYALSKKLSEQVCEFYAKNFNVPAIIIRPFNIYGPNQRKEFLIPEMLNKILFGNEVQVKDIDPKRDYLYIDDFINAICSITEVKTDFEVYNVGYGKSYSVEDIIKLAQRIANKEEMEIIVKGERRKNEIMDVVADIKKLKDQTGWEPKVSLAEGLNLIIKSIKEDN
jgi:nucleoside-diphosphate-sugar epimerase